jgi:hypothetical protein
MFSYPESDEVLDDLGDKVVEALARTVARAKDDLAQYREWKPGWVAQSSERGLANWIHDRIWYHITVLLDGVAEVGLVDVGPTREIYVGTRYRLRAKRHGEDGNVSTYPTQGATDFLFQDPIQLTLEGMEEIRLICGYTWVAETREMGQPVLSLRDGKDEIVWLIELPDVGTGYGDAGAPVTPIPPTPTPTPPQIELASERQADTDNTAEDSSP